MLTKSQLIPTPLLGSLWAEPEGRKGNVISVPTMWLWRSSAVLSVVGSRGVVRSMVSGHSTDKTCPLLYIARSLKNANMSSYIRCKTLSVAIFRPQCNR